EGAVAGEGHLSPGGQFALYGSRQAGACFFLSPSPDLDLRQFRCVSADAAVFRHVDCREFTMHGSPRGTETADLAQPLHSNGASVPTKRDFELPRLVRLAYEKSNGFFSGSGARAGRFFLAGGRAAGTGPSSANGGGAG